MNIPNIEGDWFRDEHMRRIYATDASIYRQLPIAIAYPKHAKDIQALIKYANENKLSLIPRAGGTSLAGQCVGNGIIVDVSRYMNDVIKIDAKNQSATVQPGIIRDDLNRMLVSEGLFFSPITSTANRATIGGMVGNNSCGSNSIIYGTTRDKIISLKAVLNDGSMITIKDHSRQEIEHKTTLNTREGDIYRAMIQLLDSHVNQTIIRNAMPKEDIHRRNTGYALDELIEPNGRTEIATPFNLGKLIAGSEGTLAFVTEITIRLDPLPPVETCILAVHFDSISAALEAVPVLMKHRLYACELMDKIILECAAKNKTQNKNRFFVKGDPDAILLVELKADTSSQLESIIARVSQDIKEFTSSYYVSTIWGVDTARVWALRSAGLGVLANMNGTSKAVACIEDTAVSLSDLSDYIKEFSEIMDHFGQRAVYYAHAGAGELHLRPILDLKKPHDRKQLFEISRATALLVKKYNGSLSGEHGDGRVRAPFIPEVLGEELYQLLVQVKDIWDDKRIFNPHKIVEALDMTLDLRDTSVPAQSNIMTTLSFEANGGLLRATEQCNGSGDCRKSAHAGGAMCPSYHATREEKHTTRARANILREYFTDGLSTRHELNDEEVKEVLDLCLSCKACASECPSNVDMAALKAEFLMQYNAKRRPKLRDWVFVNLDNINTLSSRFKWLYNITTQQRAFSAGIKKLMGIAPQRSLPKLSDISFSSWIKKNRQKPKGTNQGMRILLFVDEFLNYNESHILIKSYELLVALGYQVDVYDQKESGRAAISKGWLRHAKKCADYHVEQLSSQLARYDWIVGVEPSVILGFRDEYPKLVKRHLVTPANQLAERCVTIDEFLAAEYEAGNISSTQFHEDEKYILFHGHCHQKALSSSHFSIQCLSIPTNYHVELIPAGCCGMAGSFGYEEEHYEVSQAVGELILLPRVRQAKDADIIAATGTSCRHQIADATARKACHPVELLWAALVR